MLKPQNMMEKSTAYNTGTTAYNQNTLRGMDTFSGEATLSIHSAMKREQILSFRVDPFFRSTLMWGGGGGGGGGKQESQKSFPL